MRPRPTTEQFLPHAHAYDVRGCKGNSSSRHAAPTCYAATGKNITAIFTPTATLSTTYTPFGTVTVAGEVEQPLQWSSEYHDPELALIYYNYRYYNPTDGRWTRRDPLSENDSFNLYSFVKNGVYLHYDKLGLALDNINECVSILVEINSKGFWGNYRTPIYDKNTLIVRDSFNVLVTPIWKQTEKCQQERQNYIECLPYKIEASLKIINQSPNFVPTKYRVIMGYIDIEEVTMLDVYSHKTGYFYVMGNNFYVHRNEIPLNAIMELEISVKKLSTSISYTYNLLFGNDLSRFAWESHKII